ncbi:MAG: DNA adenine methylase [Planctomycetaceae bacterium]|jgi:DNA adenine methylase|nr:DNA adenine methylase [Planctomycetaceae bacterium]
MRISISSNLDTSSVIHPFVKWAGGKGQLLDEIQKLYPAGLGTTYTKYAEPFVGGGAVLCDILSQYNIKSVYISDINRELILTYTIIRDSVNELVDALDALQKTFLPLPTLERKQYYYAKRKRFNVLKTECNISEPVECAALFIFLNRTCFNGLYRVNSKGQHNVPMGSYVKPRICDSDNLCNLSQKLKHIEIVCDDYKKSRKFIDGKTFVYFDPPYRPISATSSFTSYTENLFDDIAQKELADFVDEMSKKGAKVVVSNSDPKNYDSNDDFFDNLYLGHHISRVEATRMINCNSDARGKINELLITNF